jgi:gliding motility-associated-like protein
MNRFKVVIFLSIIFFTQNLFAQVDTVTFRFERDISTFKVRCIAQKIVDVDTTEFNTETTPVDTNYTYTWSGDGIISNNGVPRVTYSFGASGIYSVSLDVVHKPSGKLYKETKPIAIVDNIIVPNVFTPNGDGANDLFIIRANGINVLEISIYTKTGAMVYSTKSPIIVWDGRNSSGSKMSEGVYYYVLTSEDSAISQNGFFHLYDPQD